jgi:sugar O-acyltransferase (sialic acid O-acetyltransferase NeuD family)
MSIKKITILGLSEATIGMVLDILDFNENYPNIEIINNINTKPTKEFINNNFNIKIINDNINIVNPILGATKNTTRIKIREFYSGICTNDFINIISNQSIISKTTNIGYGIIICPLTYVSAHSTIKDFVYINRNCSIGHHTIINEFTTINPGVNIAGNVVIGKNCQIGIGSNIIDGVSIGNNTIIGAGSVVTKNIPDNVFAYGNPCKIIKENVTHNNPTI